MHLKPRSECEYEQIPLIFTVDRDDEILMNSPDAEWYRILKFLEWKNYRVHAADYYDALFDFNRLQAQKNAMNGADALKETKEEATARILTDRPTVDETRPTIYQPEPKIPEMKFANPHQLAPGITPEREGGKKPKCFFALLKSFIGAPLLGFAPEPENVFHLLTTNLSFARVCGFVPKEADDIYWHSHVPSLRKLEQYDQIMTEYGIWERIRLGEIEKNISSGVIRRENTLVGDTTHFHARSGFQVAKAVDANGKEIKKSQSKTIKKMSLRG